MLSWLEFGILLLKLANYVIGEVRRQSAIDEGRRQVIAENLVEISRKTGVAKEVFDHAAAMSDQELDDALRGLEPPGGVQPRSGNR